MKLKPLLYLELMQFVNSIKNTVRSPKRLILALIFAACFFSWVLNTVLYMSGAAHPDSHGLASVLNAPQHVHFIKSAIFLLLCFGSLTIVFQAFSNGSLVFSVAHIDFLFPTPISRRSVLLVKLFKDYMKYAFWVVFSVIFMGIPIASSLNLNLFPYGLLSIAALIAYLLFIVNIAHTVNLIFTFGYQRLKQIGIIIKIMLGLSIASAIALGAFQYVNTNGNCYLSVIYAVNSPVIKTIFAPADWCASIILSPIEPPSYTDLAHLGMLWALAAASFALLISRRENIYEPSLGISAKMTKMRQAMKSGDATAIRVQMMSEKGQKRPGLLRIPPFGRGAVALLWKNLLIRYRMSMGQMIAMLVMPALLCYLLGRFVPVQSVMRYLPLTLLYLAFVLSITVQPQVRSELKHANILKSMPIEPWKIIFAMAAHGAIYLTAGILIFAVCMWIFVPPSRGSMLDVCAVSAPFLGFACISATIIPALMYPNMCDNAQNYFANLIGFILISIAVVPAAILGILLIFVWKTSCYFALVPLCIVNVLVGAACVAISGAIFRKFDPTSE